jgi:hypothetical protein
MTVGKAASVVSVVLLALAASACTAEAPAVDRQTVEVSESAASADTGNDRPGVTFDGPMVRRRLVLAVTRAAPDVPAVRAALERAADRLGMDLTDLPGTVLSARDLDGFFPRLTLALPEGRGIAEGRNVLDTVVDSAALPHGAITLATVLVHDLAFSVPTPESVAVAQSVEAEGILSDVLGAYDAVPGERELRIGYTGPLLSDRSIRAVRVGMARAADTDVPAVAVLPRTPTGDGVRLPDPASAPDNPAVRAAREPSTHGGHEGGVAAPTEEAAPPPVPPLLPVAAGLVLLWVVLPVIAGRRRAGDSARVPGRGSGGPPR